MLELYAAIWRVSWKRQIILIGLSIAIAVLAAVPLAYQKDIINGLSDRSLDHERLLRLCGEMIALIGVSLALKWLLSFRSGALGEDMIRLLRARIYQDSVARTVDPDTAADSAPPVAAGTRATMISAEAEELGKFTGGAFSDPVVQVGTLISVIGYIASTQPVLGLIALAMIAPQVVLVLATQRQVNRLVAERVRLLRGATNTVVTDGFATLRQDVLDEFDRIFETRRRMFLWKLSTKFVLSLLNAAGTVFVLLLGGWYVVEGRTDVGTVVAATAGLARLQGPTTFLIAFYRQVSATRVKFDLLRQIVQPPTKPS